MADDVSPDGAAQSPSPALISARLLTALVVGQLGLHSAMAGLRMAAPLQLLREGRTAWAVGLLLALFSAAAVLSALQAGRLADRLGYHRPVFVAVAISVAGCLLAWLSTLTNVMQGDHSQVWQFSLLCLAAMATGAGANLGMLTIQRSAGQLARNSTERVRIFSWMGVAPAFSNVIGPVTAGVLIDLSGFRAAYLFLLALPFATLLTARLVPHLAPAGAAIQVAGRRAWDLLSAPGMKRLLMVNLLLSACWDVHTFAVPVLGHDRGFSASTIGLLLGSFTLSITGVRLLLPLVAHRLSEVTVLRAAMLGTGVIFAVYPLAPSAWSMGVCAVLLGVTLGCVQPMVLNMLHYLTPDQRYGEALAFRSMAMHLSSTVMPLAFGAAGALAGAALLFWAIGGAVGAGSWLARGLQRPADELKR
jgi:MFS family permease